MVNVLTQLKKSGFDVSLNDQNGIVVSPASKLSEQQREIIKKNKTALVAELQTHRYWHVVTPTDDVRFNVIPPLTIVEIRAKFPKAIVVEPVETLQ